jgi:hypothetical protein
MDRTDRGWRREVVDYRVMERLRRRVEQIVKDKQTAEALKPPQSSSPARRRRTNMCAASRSWRPTFPSSNANVCPPSYFNNEGEAKPNWALFRSYGPGWDAFQKLLQDWRTKGDLNGLVLER